MTDHNLSGTGGTIARPKSLYIEATGIKDDGTEFVVKMRLEAVTTSDSAMILNMENLTVDDDSNGMYRMKQPTGEQNVRIEFTRCRLGDPDA